MDFEAETWDVSEEANQLNKLLFTATPGSNVKNKIKKKSVERTKQASDRPEQPDIRSSSNNDNNQHGAEQHHVAGNNKTGNNSGKSVEKLTSDYSLNLNVDSGSNRAVLNKMRVNKKKDSKFSESGLKQNTDENKNNTESRPFKRNEKKSKVGKFEEFESEKNKGSKDIIDTEDSAKLGKQPKKKKRKICDEKFTRPPSEEISNSNVNDLLHETKFETVGTGYQFSNKRKRKGTFDGEKDGYESHSKNKKKTKTLSSEIVNTERKISKENNNDLSKIHTDTEIPSPAKKKKKANKNRIDISPNTNGGVIQTGMNLKNGSASNKSETSSQRKQKTIQQTEYQMCDNLMQDSRENNKTKKKRKRKKDKSLTGAGINDTKLSSTEPTMKTSESSKVTKEDTCLKGNENNKKLMLSYSEESLKSDNIGATVTGNKRDNESKNIEEKSGSKDNKSQKRNFLPFTPLKIKKLLAEKTDKSCENVNISRGKQKNLEKAGIDLNFDRSKHALEESLNLPKKKTKDLVVKSNSLLEQNRAKLEAARFRFINEQLYSRTGAEALDLFKDEPEAFEVYHKGFQNQVEKWPVNPLDVIIDFVLSLSSKKVVADFGCGDAKLAQSVPNKVHSFDLVALNKHVTVCDISNVPLPDFSVDIAVFCLSLMGTNFSSYLSEANRVLKKGGTLIIAEVSSRFHKLKDFLGDLKRLGFKSVEQDTKNQMFVLMKFKKKSTLKKTVIKQMKLKPCMYKKR